MCGIFGEFSLKGNLTDEPVFRKLNDLAILRGPDSAGHWTDGTNCQLGFRRLAILDLRDDANQPMLSQNRDWVMVFNGEVYNYIELRKKLPADRQNFKTHSDTETILALIEHFGPHETAAMLDGMFGIAAYHIPSKKLYLIRDFAGIKPVFYSKRNGMVVFGSQYDLLSKHPAMAGAGINQAVLKTYLQWHYVPAPLGLLADSYQLRPGEIKCFGVDGYEDSKTYWEFPAYKPASVTRKEEALELIDSELSKAVKDEMVSDVPLGTFLSGGIDSPLVAWYAARNSTTKLKAFSIGSDSPKHDESDDAAWYAEKIGADFHLDKMNAAAALSMLDKVLDSLKEPMADFSVIPTYLVSKHARSQLTVSLSGDGGDELFYGYERFWSLMKNKPYQNFSSIGKKALYGLDKFVLKRGLVNDNLLVGSISEAHGLLHSRMRKSMVEEIFPKLAAIEIPKEFDVYIYSDKGSNEEVLHSIAKAEFYGMMQKTLAKVDRASMSNSLEVRVPFLKKSFIEASLKINPLLSYGTNKKKQLLKDLLIAKTGNKPSTNDTKRGFTVPLNKWLKEELREPVREAIFHNNFIDKYGIDKPKLQQLFEEHQQGKDRKWPLWTMYVLAEWERRR